MSDFASATRDENTDEFVCSRCNVQYTSRNKLFRHIKQCAVLQKLYSLARVDAEIQSQNEKVGILVLGGRLRGRTLASVECFDVNAQEWLSAELPPILENRGSHAAAAVGDEVYVVGGGGFDSNLSACEKFRGRSGWSVIAALSTPRHALAATTVNNKVYAVGGWIDGSVCSSHLEVYDADNNVWRELASMRVARRLHGVAAYKNTDLFVFGGSCNDPHWHTADVERYNIATNSWSSCKSVPDAGGNAAAGVVTPEGHELIFVFVFGKRVYCYDPETDIYIPLSPLPVFDWHCFQVATVGAHIYAVGGAAAGKWSRVIYRYNTMNDSWTQMADMHVPRRRCAVAVVPIDSICNISGTSAAENAPNSSANI